MIINATMNVFLNVAMNPQFMPTARKFHYQFNLRDFARIVQNIMLAQPIHYKGKPTDIARLWAHECNRIWGDRLIFKEDMDLYNGFMRNGSKEFGEKAKEDEIFAEPNIFTSFIASCDGHEPTYLPIRDID
jgi:dynein heavy chain